MKKTFKIVMLPTEYNKGGVFCLSLMNILINSSAHPKNDSYKNFNLYIISDDEIKKGDWCINLDSPYQHKELCRIDNSIELERYVNKKENNCKKIIATTDESINDKLMEDNADFMLPNIPESFIQAYIKAYNEGNVIKEVELEIYFETILSGTIIKTNSNNEVIISTIKETYTRDEVIDLLYKCPEGVSLKEFKNWITNNL